MNRIVNDRVTQNIIKDCPYSCSLLFWGTCVRLYSDDADVIERFKLIYSRFVVSTCSQANIICCIACSSPGFNCPVFLIDQRIYELPKTDRSIHQAELILFHHLLDRLENYIVLHAGVVTRGGRALVIYGQSGFGKTTLTMELLRRGYGFMSDEFCPIRISDFLIEPFERQIGLKKNSPFYSLFNDQPLFSQDKDGTRSIDSVFSSVPVQPCRAAAFIEINPVYNQDICPPGGVALDICMCHDGTDVLSALRALPGVDITGPLKKEGQPAYRVTALDRHNFIGSFNTLWAEYNNDIFSVFPYKGEIETFDCAPSLDPVPAFKALTSLTSNIVNRCPTSRLLQNHGGKTGSLVMLLGSILQNTPCYSIQPGHLKEMADLIDDL